MQVTTWTGCYSNQWRNLIVPDAFSHPAKFSPGLIQKIYAHGIERGYFKEGDLIEDPFGGIGGGGIFAAYAGLKWVGIELEQKFVQLARENFALHIPTWEAHGYHLPMMVQGDSRRFSEIVGGCDGVITKGLTLNNASTKMEKNTSEVDRYVQTECQNALPAGQISEGCRRDLQCISRNNKEMVAKARGKTERTIKFEKKRFNIFITTGE